MGIPVESRWRISWHVQELRGNKGTAMAGIAEPAFDRDSMARWYARRDMETDAGVEQIYYFPTNAPAREIRFLEVNRFISEVADPEPIDFGVNIGDADGLRCSFWM